MIAPWLSPSTLSMIRMLLKENLFHLGTVALEQELMGSQLMGVMVEGKVVEMEVVEELVVVVAPMAGDNHPQEEGVINLSMAVHLLPHPIMTAHHHPVEENNKDLMQDQITALLMATDKKGEVIQVHPEGEVEEGVEVDLKHQVAIHLLSLDMVVLLQEGGLHLLAIDHHQVANHHHHQEVDHPRKEGLQEAPDQDQMMNMELLIDLLEDQTQLVPGEVPDQIHPMVHLQGSSSVVIMKLLVPQGLVVLVPLARMVCLQQLIRAMVLLPSKSLVAAKERVSINMERTTTLLLTLEMQEICLMIIMIIIITD